MRAGPIGPRPRGDGPDDQYERTLLAWRRTALSLVVAGLLISHLMAKSTGPVPLVVSLAATAGVLGLVQVGHGRLVGGAGLALVLGVLVLGGTALVGVAAR